MLTSSEATIRRANLGDYEEVCRLMDVLDALHRERLPLMFKIPSEQPRSRGYFTDLLGSEDSTIFVADAGNLVGVAVGIMRAAPELPVFIQQRWGVLDSLVVEPAWRRCGIGKMLAQSVERWAIGLGAQWIEVNVYDVNDEARGFYEASGYAPLSMKLRRFGSDNVR